MPPPSYRPLDENGNEIFPDVIQRDGVCYIKTSQTANNGVTLEDDEYNSFENLEPCHADLASSSSSSSSSSTTT